MNTTREYHFGSSLIIGIDHGYGNIKTAHRVFPTGIIKSDKLPTFSRDFVEYDGNYYIIGEGHKGFVADKNSDDDNYILTMAALAKELERRGLTEADVHLAVGLPLKWVQSQRESFKEYLMRSDYLEYKYRNRPFKVRLTGCTVMPQCYAAVAETLRDFAGMHMLVDIGNGTMNIMFLSNGRPMESKSWTEKYGIHQCFLKIQNEIMDATGVKVQDEVINNYLRTGTTDVDPEYAVLMEKAAKAYVAEIFGKLRDYEYNEKLMKLYIMGGGARIVEAVGEYNPDKTVFNHDIKATAKGYEYYCYMSLRHQNR